jgi:hypothetical protein
MILAGSDGDTLVPEIRGFNEKYPAIPLGKLHGIVVLADLHGPPRFR